MTPDHLFDALGTIDDDLIDDCDTPPVKRIISRPLLRGISAVCAACAVVVTTLALAPPGTPSSPPSLSLTVPTTVDDSGRQLRSFSCLGAEGAYVWPWDCRTTIEQFTVITHNGQAYTARDAVSNNAVIGEALGTGIATGYDIYTDTTHTADCTVFAVRDVDTDRYVAVRFAEDDTTYIYHRDEFSPPATLGEWMTAVNAADNIALPRFTVGDTDAALTDTTGLWDVLEQAADAPFVGNDTDSVGNTLVSFYVTSDTLGVTIPRYWSITDGGYAQTNFDDYLYRWYIGVDTAYAVAAFANTHSGSLSEQQTDRILVGTVTAIADDHLVISDGVILVDPAKERHYTVNADHIHVSRYIRSGFLQVGDTVRITYHSVNETDPLVITDATGLDKVILVFDGDNTDVLIPE